MSDPEKRPTVMDLMHGVKGRVYPVGRLDYASEGLLLMTNDGELAHQPDESRIACPKNLRCKSCRHAEQEAIAKLRAGVNIATDDGRA